MHAHEITDAEAREVSSCYLRASKRFENVWPSFRRTQARNDHVCASLLPSWMLESASSDADSASLSAKLCQHLTNSQKKKISLAEFRFQSMQNSGYIPDGDMIFSECRIGLRRWI